MKVTSDVIKDKITTALQVSPHGASSVELESLTPYERHTISKYLLILKQEGMVDYKQAGPAKIWFLIKSPLKKITQVDSSKRTYVENVLLNLLEKIPVCVLVIDSSCTIQYLNETAKKMYGDKTDEPIYSEIFGLPNPLSLQSIMDILHNKKKKSNMIVSDQNQRILDMRISRLTNFENSICCVVIFDDITHTITQQTKLPIFNQIARQTDDIVIVTTEKGTIEYVNRSFERQTGYTCDEVIGKTPNILKSGKQSSDFYANLWETISSGKSFKGVFKNKKKNGQFFTEQKIITPIRDKNKIIHFVSTGKILTTK